MSPYESLPPKHSTHTTHTTHTTHSGTLGPLYDAGTDGRLNTQGTDRQGVGKSVAQSGRHRHGPGQPPPVPNPGAGRTEARYPSFPIGRYLR
jgi:hypothetical protein